MILNSTKRASIRCWLLIKVSSPTSSCSNHLVLLLKLVLIHYSLASVILIILGLLLFNCNIPSYILSMTHIIYLGLHLIILSWTKWILGTISRQSWSTSRTTTSSTSNHSRINTSIKWLNIGITTCIIYLVIQLLNWLTTLSILIIRNRWMLLRTTWTSWATWFT